MRLSIKIFLNILFAWLVITLLTQYTGDKLQNHSKPDKDIILVYNPDPFYNLDEQVCNSFKKGLESQNLLSQITTTDNFNLNKKYEFYLFCVNTYNWAPDWKSSKLIKKLELENVKVGAIVLGGGSTKRANRKLKGLLQNKSANILGMKEIWLLKPNNENNPNGDNIKEANDAAASFGAEIGAQLNKQKSRK